MTTMRVVGEGERLLWRAPRVLLQVAPEEHSDGRPTSQRYRVAHVMADARARTVEEIARAAGHTSGASASARIRELDGMGLFIERYQDGRRVWVYRWAEGRTVIEATLERLEAADIWRRRP